MIDAAFKTRSKNYKQDPFNMNPNNVRISSFINGDSSLYYSNDDGFEVQPWVRRKCYNAWLKSIRSRQGWEKFRRTSVYEPPSIDHTTVVFNNKQNHESEVVVRKSNISSNRKMHLPAGSKITGQKYDDQEYIPKMITLRMGSEISKARQRQNMTQSDLAKRLNVSVNYIRDVELGNLVTFNSQDPILSSMARELKITPIKYLSDEQ